MPVPAKELALILEAGYVYRYAGRFREARDIFQGVRVLLPGKDIGDLALAGVSLDEGKFDEAEAHCRRAIELNRRSAAAYVQLAEIQLLQKDGAGARKSIEKSMELSPNGPSAAVAKVLTKLAAIIAPKD